MDQVRPSDVSPCPCPKGLLKDQNAVLVLVLEQKSLSCPCDCVQMEIAIIHVALIAKYFTTDKHFTYYLLSSEGWHF